MRLEVDEHNFPHAQIVKMHDWDIKASVFCEKLQRQDKHHFFHSCKNGRQAVYESRDDFNKTTPRCYWMNNRSVKYFTCQQCLSHEYKQQTRAALSPSDHYTQTPLFILAQTDVDNKDNL